MSRPGEHVAGATRTGRAWRSTRRSARACATHRTAAPPAPPPRRGRFFPGLGSSPRGPSAPRGRRRPMARPRRTSFDPAVAPPSRLMALDRRQLSGIAFSRITRHSRRTGSASDHFDWISRYVRARPGRGPAAGCQDSPSCGGGPGCRAAGPRRRPSGRATRSQKRGYCGNRACQGGRGRTSTRTASASIRAARPLRRCGRRSRRRRRGCCGNRACQGGRGRTSTRTASASTRHATASAVRPADW